MRIGGQAAYQPKPVVRTVRQRMQRFEIADLARQDTQITARHIRRVDRHDVDCAPHVGWKRIEHVTDSEVHVANPEPARVVTAERDSRG